MNRNGSGVAVFKRVDSLFGIFIQRGNGSVRRKATCRIPRSDIFIQSSMIAPFEDERIALEEGGMPLFEER